MKCTQAKRYLIAAAKARKEEMENSNVIRRYIGKNDKQSEELKREYAKLVIKNRNDKWNNCSGARNYMSSCEGRDAELTRSAYLNLCTDVNKGVISSPPKTSPRKTKELMSMSPKISPTKHRHTTKDFKHCPSNNRTHLPPSVVDLTALVNNPDKTLKVEDPKHTYQIKYKYDRCENKRQTISTLRKNEQMFCRGEIRFGEWVRCVRNEGFSVSVRNKK